MVNQSGETLSRTRGKERKEIYIALQGKDILLFILKGKPEAEGIDFFISAIELDVLDERKYSTLERIVGELTD